MSRAKIAAVELDGCSGCRISQLDLDEALVELAGKIELVFGPLVQAQEFPEGVDVPFVEGAVSSQDDLKLAQTVRARSRFAAALANWAVAANVPFMHNSIPPKQLLERLHVDGVNVNHRVPADGVPLLRKAAPLHEVFRVDPHVPGCPPPAAAIGYVINELLAGRKPDLAGKVKFG